MDAWKCDGLADFPSELFSPSEHWLEILNTLCLSLLICFSKLFDNEGQNNLRSGKSSLFFREETLYWYPKWCRIDINFSFKLIRKVIDIACFTNEFQNKLLSHKSEQFLTILSFLFFLAILTKQVRTVYLQGETSHNFRLKSYSCYYYIFTQKSVVWNLAPHFFLIITSLYLAVVCLHLARNFWICEKHVVRNTIRICQMCEY